MNKKLMDAVIELLESGDDEGCDGLVVVGLDEFVALRKLVEKETGVEYGSIRIE